MQWGNSMGGKKIRIVPDNTAEAQTAMASRATKDIVAVRMILEDMRAAVRGPTTMYVDCKATRDIITKPGSTQRTRCFERRTMLVRRMYVHDAHLFPSINQNKRHGC